MFPGQMVSGGVVQHPSEHRAGPLGASKGFCDASPTDFLGGGSQNVHTQQSSRLHPACERRPSKGACWSLLRVKSARASELWGGTGGQEDTEQHHR